MSNGKSAAVGAIDRGVRRPGRRRQSRKLAGRDQRALNLCPRCGLPPGAGQLYCVPDGFEIR